MNVNHQMFIVRFGGPRTFFTRRDNDGHARGSFFPGLAQGMTYGAAFRVAQALRDLGYVDAVVCTASGRPASTEDIGTNAEDVRAQAEFIEVWGDEASPEVEAAR
jgi:hypothetical protein